MSILSSIKSAGKKVAVGVYNTVNSVKSSVGKALSGASNVGSVAMASPAKQAVQNISVKTGPGITYTAMPTKSTGASGITSLQPFGTLQTPQQSQTAKTVQSIAANSYGGQTPVQNYSSYVGYSPYTAPKTVSAGGKPISSSSLASMDAMSTVNPVANRSITSTPTSNVSLSSNVLSASPSISMPSSPSYSNVGTINSAGLDTGMSDIFTKDPATGQYVKVPQEQKTPEQLAAEERQSSIEELMGMVPRKDSVLNSEEYRQQQEVVNQNRQELNNYTAQLNSIVAKQNQDLLSTRGTLSAEGGTEAVYGGIAATINREAAIKALPVQAQIAAAQGNLELAQDYLSQVKSIKEEQIDADYNYNVAKFSAIKDYVKGEEKIKLDSILKNEERAHANAKTNLETQKSWAELAIKQGKSNLVAQINAVNVGDPNFTEKIGKIVSQIPGATTATTGKYNATQDKQIDQINTSIDNNFNFKAVASAKNATDGVIASLGQKSGLGDIAAINQFQKVIDEGAVTRDQDVKLVQSAQSLADTLKLKIKKLQKGDQLSDSQRKEMATVATNLYQAKVDNLLEAPYVKSQIIKAEQNGIDTKDTILGELGTFGTQSSGNTNKPSPGAIIESGGKRYRVGADGETLEQI